MSIKTDQGQVLFSFVLTHTGAQEEVMSFMISKSEQQQHIFTNRMIRNLLIPVVLEQLLNSIMGTADTMMVSNVGSAAISAVSLVDSINVLVIQAFSTLAAGGAIVCAYFLSEALDLDRWESGSACLQTGLSAPLFLHGDFTAVNG